MKKPEDPITGEFSEFMWMAEDGAEEGLEQQASLFLIFTTVKSCGEWHG